METSNKCSEPTNSFEIHSFSQHTPDGQLILRRSSESGSTSTGAAGSNPGQKGGSQQNSSSASSRNEPSAGNKVPWKPY